MSFGPPPGSPFAGGGSPTGLPFAGIPPEVAERAQRIMDTEPEHRIELPPFSHHQFDRSPFGLRRFLAGSWTGVSITAALVVIETVLLQVGPLLTARAIDDGVRPGNTQVLLRIGMIYIAVIALSAAMSAGRTAWTARLGERLVEQLRIRVFSHLQRMGVDWYSREKSGVILTRMTSDIDNLSMLFQEGLVQLGVQSLAVVVISAAMLLLNWQLGLFTLVVVMPALIALTMWFRGASNHGYDLVRDRISALLADLAESLSGIRVIAALNRRNLNLATHRDLARAHMDANVSTARVGAIYGPATEGLGTIAQAAVLGVGAGMVADGTLTVGQLVAFLLYVNLCFAPIQQLVQQFTTYQQGQSSVRKLREILATEPSVPEDPEAVPLAAVQGTIELENVTFSYLPGSPVLDHVNLRIEAGETFAVVGRTGAGKSTIAKLVIRLMDPDSGTVRLDGHDLRTVTLRSLRSQLGVVPQEPFLFSTSIRDNLVIGRPGVSDAELIDTLRTIGLGSLLDRLPEGLDSPCHDRGGTFSTGERQLLALARAFLARPRVLILDEATSSLDLASEQKVEAALDLVLDGRTAIVIAHRMSTAMRADRIAVVDGGRIVELGSHEQLVAAGGHYAAMVDTWRRHSGARTP